MAFKLYIIQTYADQNPRWTQSVDLSGIRYKFYIWWNTRAEAWSLAISDVNDKMLLAGIRLVPQIDLLGKYRATVPGLPPGMLLILDNEDNPQTAELTRDNFGTRFVLTYSYMEE
jgi:hypothetical protein